MAKQGNYVNTPSGGANWAKGFSDSLANISKTFSDRAASKVDQDNASQRNRSIELENISREASRLQEYTRDENRYKQKQDSLSRKDAQEQVIYDENEATRNALGNFRLGNENIIFSKGLQDTINSRNSEIDLAEKKYNADVADINVKSNYFDKNRKLTDSGTEVYKDMYFKAIDLNMNDADAKAYAKSFVGTEYQNAAGTDYIKVGADKIAKMRKDQATAVSNIKPTLREYVNSSVEQIVKEGVIKNPRSQEVRSWLEQRGKSLGYITAEDSAAGAEKRNVDNYELSLKTAATNRKINEQNNEGNTKQKITSSFSDSYGDWLGSKDDDERARALTLLENVMKMGRGKGGISPILVKDAIRLSSDDDWSGNNILDPGVDGNIAKVFNIAVANDPNLRKNTTTPVIKNYVPLNQKQIDNARVTFDEQKMPQYSQTTDRTEDIKRQVVQKADAVKKADAIKKGDAVKNRVDELTPKFGTIPSEGFLGLLSSFAKEKLDRKVLRQAILDVENEELRAEEFGSAKRRQAETDRRMLRTDRQAKELDNIEQDKRMSRDELRAEAFSSGQTRLPNILPKGTRNGLRYDLLSGEARQELLGGSRDLGLIRRWRNSRNGTV